MNETKEKTALNASVGADAGQSIQSKTTEIITAESPEINDLEDISQEKFFQQMQRMADPAYLHTVSMNELYETVYQSRQPVIEGLLYSGTYLFAGAPKMGKSFFMAQLAYHVSTGQVLLSFCCGEYDGYDNPKDVIAEQMIQSFKLSVNELLVCNEMSVILKPN